MQTEQLIYLRNVETNLGHFIPAWKNFAITVCYIAQQRYRTAEASFI